ncbi:hypothetical protein [Marinilabilia salmonicolor]|jgi:hypothetical protein|uniref:Capsule assembly protein Wzi n=1 Tax=Marinilabilia salmonicolor TaxID=989 RepID=A0A368VB73_9BACT|nr:hypothetical protein [Marinilabilia salmonicolor]RCW37570.1 capsule assembly protein Wzi [Marinilabilia salmonicolor]
MLKRTGRLIFISVLFLRVVLPFENLHGQQVPVHIDNYEIYELLDELADLGVIDINTIARPYGRKFISDRLVEASEHDGLPARIKKEIAFYLRDYQKEQTRTKPENKRFDLFYYSDSLFQVTVNPVLGLEVLSSGGDLAWHRFNGGELHGTIGEHFGFYASLRDNHESELLGGTDFLVSRRGAVYKSDDDSGDYSEARGGITWSWKWGTAGLHKNSYQWGYGYNGTNIFSGNTPSHAYFSLTLSPLPWVQLDYMHGWLVSEVVDSAESFNYYDGTREVFANKYVAANLITVRPLAGLYISAGNSIVYADTNVNPAFLNPVMFYKSVDHTYNGASNEVGQNAQMFFGISSRQIRNLHLYSTFFVDEISTNRMFDKEQQSNYISLKAGARLTNIVDGTALTVEYTRSNPMVYQHKIPTTTWESNRYNMGHYLKDNSDEIFLSLKYRPVRGVRLELSHLLARKGKDYQEIIKEGTESDYSEINSDEPRWGLPFMDEVRWEMQKTEFKGSWQIINDGYVYFSVIHRDISGADREKYLPPFLNHNGLSGKFGINYGF